MKVNVKIAGGRYPENPIESVITLITSSMGHEVGALAEDTAFVITNDVRHALSSLKDSDARVVIVLRAGLFEDKSAVAAAASLAEAYPGRVDAVPTIAFDGEEELVPYLQRHLGAKESA